jgi:glycosidase
VVSLFLSSNAMTFTFMSDGIPIVYYGQEQYFSGNADPVRDSSQFYIDCLLLDMIRPAQQRTFVAISICKDRRI